MDYDKGLVTALFREGIASLRLVRSKLPSKDYLQGEGKTIYDFLEDYLSQYSEMPSLTLVQEHTGISLDDPLTSEDELAAPSMWWLDHIVERRLYSTLTEIGASFREKLEAGDPTKALDLIEKGIKLARRETLSGDSGIQGIGPLSMEVRDYYQDLKSGKRGILTPWDGINQATLGFWPQDLALFVARAGTGKTWSAVLIALKAWEDGKKVLFATTEISRMKIAMRLMAAKYKFRYDDFRKGQLGDAYDSFLNEKCEELMKDNNFFVAGGDFDFRIEAFTSVVEEYEPDLCILDGAYLLRVEGKNRSEKAANAFDEVKRIANGTGVPMVCTMQFNRQAKANMASTADLANIGLTDVAAWNADSAYALVQTDEQKADGIMEYHPMKVREGVGDIVTIRWDLDNMEFGQISTGGGNDIVDGDAAEDEEFSPPFKALSFSGDSGSDTEVPF